jgi:hypothetical protein
MYCRYGTGNVYKYEICISFTPPPRSPPLNSRYIEVHTVLRKTYGTITTCMKYEALIVDTGISFYAGLYMNLYTELSCLALFNR